MPQNHHTAFSFTENSTAQPAFTASLSRWLLAVGLGSLLLRVWIAVTFPISGDEAFFYWWGVYPDWIL